jgi:hypothetical protein
MFGFVQSNGVVHCACQKYVNVKQAWVQTRN